MQDDDGVLPMSAAQRVCSHVWIDPDAAPLERRPIAPIIGDQPGQMKDGARYVCRDCGLETIAYRLRG